ncbi:MAG: hypothetical protein ACRCXD_01820 [Luteolibacter sp.]
MVDGESGFSRCESREKNAPARTAKKRRWNSWPDDQIHPTLPVILKTIAAKSILGKATRRCNFAPYAHFEESPHPASDRGALDFFAADAVRPR